MERSAGPALQAAHDAGLGVIVKEALANGRLLEHVTDTVAIAAALAQPWADVVLSGAATVEQLESNLRALDTEYNGSYDGLIEDPETYWSTRAALPWN
jgi:aryl-alcohol dehydrogenase-like predicted oxidoreductase